METRTVGVEEELLLIDPLTRRVSSRAREVLREHRERGSGGHGSATSDQLDQELFRHQLETRTDPTRSLGEIKQQLVAARATAWAAARAQELAVAACASIPLGGEHPEVSPNERYRDMMHIFGEVARNGTTCGMHVHVAIDSPEEGVGCIDRMAPWLPVLLAMSSNSPFSNGRDTGYMSWRSQLWSRWPSAGPTEAFGSLAGYREACDRLIATGAARDTGMLYFDARLAQDFPTVEVRVLDVCTDVADAVLLAGLVRALVETCALQWAAEEPWARWRSEELRAASWRASRMGLSDQLVHPLRRELAPARAVLADILELLGPRLETAGDLNSVQEGAARVLQAGGATRQRAAYERTGSLDGVVDDLIARTEASTSGG